MNRRNFLGGAALSVVLLGNRAGADRRRGLLTEGSQAPDFTAGGVTLGEYRDRHRVILVFDPPPRYLEGLAAHERQYEDRDLVVLAFVTPGTAEQALLPRFVSVSSSRTEAAGPYHEAGEGTVFYLIGKDGHIAVARLNIPRDEELFAVIDAMPMRRREVRERGR